MRNLSPVRVSLHRFVAWRVAVLSLAALAAASTTAWVLLAPSAEPAWIRAGAACGLAAIAGSAAWLWSRPATPADLQWDGTVWRLFPAQTRRGRPGDTSAAIPEAGSGAPSLGSIVAMIDVDSWMLLRFVGHAADGRRVVRWLPAERSALGADWHALRCAVHAPPTRPAVRAGARAPRA